MWASHLSWGPSQLSTCLKVRCRKHKPSLLCERFVFSLAHEWRFLESGSLVSDWRLSWLHSDLFGSFTRSSCSRAHAQELIFKLSFGVQNNVTRTHVQLVMSKLCSWQNERQILRFLGIANCLFQDPSRWREDLVYFEVDFPEAKWDEWPWEFYVRHMNGTAASVFGNRKRLQEIPVARQNVCFQSKYMKLNQKRAPWNRL